MKKSILTVAMVIAGLAAQAQWVTRNVDNKIDDPYKIAYVENTTKRALLKLEDVDGELALYVTGSYFCDDYPSVDIALMVNGEPKRYSITGSKSSDSQTIFLYDNLLEAENMELLDNFKKCSSFLIRINESHCTDEFYVFNMTGSTAAVSFMSNGVSFTFVKPRM